MNLGDYMADSVKGSGHPAPDPDTMIRIHAEWEAFHQWCNRTGHVPGRALSINQFTKGVKKC